jgi:hypothetical protein
LTKNQVEGKFRTYARGRLPNASIEQVVAAVWELEDLANTRVLMDLLRREGASVRQAVAA